MANPVTLQEFAYLLDKNIDEVLKDYLDPVKMVSKQLFGQKTTNRLFLQSASVGSYPDIPEFNGKVEYQGIAPGFQTRVETREFAGGLIIERRLIDTAEHDEMRDRQESMARALQRTKEKRAANVLNYAFSASWEFMTNDEGVALCGAHTTKSGVPTTTGFSNYGSSALSKTSILATAVAMMKLKDDIGEYFDIIPDTIIVPVALYDAACEAVGYDPRSGAESKLDPTSANNAINPAYGRFKVVPWIYLDQNSTTSWFMVDSRMMKKFATWVDRIAQEKHTIMDYETMSIKQIIYSSFAVYWKDWRFIYGHSV